MSPKTQEGLGYFPLTVEFEERFYAAGKILGSRFMRREGRPTDEAVLSGRIVDRTIRPLFAQHIRNEVQVVITVLSIDEDDPDILAVNAASLALATSAIPWSGPVSAVRVAKIKGREGFIVNPTYPIREHEDIELDLIACGKDGDINMIEVNAQQVPESLIAAALEKASEEIEKIQAFQKKIIAEIGKYGNFDAQYVNVNGQAGYFAHSLNAYGRTGEPCPRCGRPIVRVSFMNRSSHYCPHCQKLPRTL
jgi:polyribonucleotide nucleotidyltransferase